MRDHGVPYHFKPLDFIPHRKTFKEKSLSKKPHTHKQLSEPRESEKVWGKYGYYFITISVNQNRESKISYEV